MGTRAAVYARISDDKAGAGLGVARQREDCGALCQRQGYTVVGVYADNDLSAYSGKPRGNYERLCRDVAAGAVDVVVAWHPDRLHRNLRELEDFIELLERTGTAVETVTAGTYDLATPSGRMIARMLGAAARHESEHKSARVQRKMQELARDGKFTGGFRMFGYDGAYNVKLDEAELIVEAAQAVLAGTSFPEVCRLWNSRNVMTVRGKQWRTDQVKDLLTNPKLAGLATYKGEVVGQGQWDAILDRGTAQQIQALAKRNGHGRLTRPARKRLLPGVIYCGLCGSRLIGGKRSGDNQQTYKCRKSPGYPGCGGLSVQGPKTDDVVRERVFAVLAGDGLARMLSAAAGNDTRQKALTDQLRRDEEALAQLTTDYYVEQRITRAEFFSVRDPLEQRIEETRRRLQPDTRAGVLAGLPSDPEALRAMWDGRGLDWRRAVIGAVVERITILPPAKRGQRFTPDRVRIEYWA